MISSEAVRCIFDTYKKYDWIPRRLLATPELFAVLQSDTAFVADTPFTSSDIDAAWFSREPKDGPVTWELRYLGEPAFALLAVVDEADPKFEDTLDATCQRLIEAVGAKKATA